MRGMCKRAIFSVGYICLWFSVGMGNSQAQTTHRVQAVIYAREAAIRTSTSNLDIYMIRLQRQTGSELEAIALDEYPQRGQELPAEMLTKPLHLSVRLSRTPYCDRVDDNRGGETKILPCFTVVHGSWKTQMRMPEEEIWWK
jgi:hypothetical protein